jgi:Tfp pilus assembly protein PilO
MSRIQQWIAGTVVAVVVIVAAGWFLAISPQKHKVSNLGSQASQQEQTNSSLRTKLATLTAAQQAVPSEQAEVAKILQKIPGDPAMPNYVRALTGIAKQTGVELVSIAPGTPTAVTIAATAVAPAAAAAATPSVAPSTAAAVPAAAVAPVSMQAISVALTVQGGYFQIQQFTAALQKLTRTTVVSAVALSPTGALKKVTLPSSAPIPPAWKSLGATITLSIFMNSSDTFASPAAPAQASGASVPGAGAATAAPAQPSASASK